MLATGLLAIPRPNGGGAWACSNGSGRTRAELLICVVFRLRRTLRLPLHIAGAISPTALQWLRVSIQSNFQI